jgi:hypothetical protein
MDAFRSVRYSDDQQMSQLPAPMDSPFTSTRVRKSRKRLWMISGALVLGSLVCLGLLTAGVIALSGALVTFASERERVERVLDGFMRAVEDKDTARAYTFMSRRATKLWAMSRMEGMIKGNNYVIFDGYRSLQVSDITIGFQSSPQPGEPQGIVAQVSGSVTYDCGYTGDFEAVLEKEGDNWRIFGIQVNVPPDKLKPNPQSGVTACSH